MKIIKSDSLGHTIKFSNREIGMLQTIMYEIGADFFKDTSWRHEVLFARVLNMHVARASLALNQQPHHAKRRDSTKAP